MKNTTANPELDIVEADNDTLRKEIQRLKEERDEARRDHLGLLKEVKDLTERHAHMSNIALGSRADVHQTRRDLDKANKERDEARRLACFLRAEIESTEPLIYCRKVAEEYKWDCFKDDSAWGWGYGEEEENANFDIGYNPHAEAEAARAEEEKKWQEEYRKRHEERMARIAATRKNAEGKNNPPF
jgi:hypothetical protein